MVVQNIVTDLFDYSEQEVLTKNIHEVSISNSNFTLPSVFTGFNWWFYKICHHRIIFRMPSNFDKIDNRLYKGHLLCYNILY
jgi:hypothetical protein